MKMRSGTRSLPLLLVAPALALGALPALADAPKPAGSYAGTTSQGKPISFKVSKGKVKSVKFGYTAPCTKGAPPVNDTTRVFASAKISSKRKFGVGEGTPSHTAEIKGKFNRKADTATGKVGATETRTLSPVPGAPEQTYTCKTPKITYTVHQR